MSPIKDPSIYPDDWPEIRTRILDRATDHETDLPRCECTGECGREHHLWLDPWKNCVTMPKEIHRCTERQHCTPVHFSGSKVVLTVAHLDHDASAGDHSPENLKAYCQACHLRYDGNHRKEQQKQKETLF